MSSTAQSHAQDQVQIGFDPVIRFLSVIVLALGLLVLAGWIFDVAALTAFIPPFSQPMSVASALVFVCLGVSLWNRKHKVCCLVVQTVVLSVGVVVTLSRAGALPIEQVLVHLAAPTRNLFMNVRMSATTSVSFSILGAIGISAVAFPNRRSVVARQVMLILLAFLILLTIIGFLYSITVLRSYGFGKGNLNRKYGMSMPSISCRDLPATARESTLLSLFDASHVGKVVRRILLLVLAVPIAVGGGVATLERGGVVSPMQALLLTVTATILPLSVLVIRQGGVILGSENQMRENWKIHRELIEHMFDGVLVLQEGTSLGNFFVTEVNDAATVLLEVRRS